MDKDARSLLHTTPGNTAVFHRRYFRTRYFGDRAAPAHMPVVRSGQTIVSYLPGVLYYRVTHYLPYSTVRLAEDRKGWWKTPISRLHNVNRDVDRGPFNYRVGPIKPACRPLHFRLTLFTLLAIIIGKGEYDSWRLISEIFMLRHGAMYNSYYIGFHGFVYVVSSGFTGVYVRMETMACRVSGDSRNFQGAESSLAGSMGQNARYRPVCKPRSAPFGFHL